MSLIVGTRESEPVMRMGDPSEFFDLIFGARRRLSIPTSHPLIPDQQGDEVARTSSRF